jgi:hypothetical protein
MMMMKHKGDKMMSTMRHDRSGLSSYKNHDFEQEKSIDKIPISDSLSELLGIQLG